MKQLLLHFSLIFIITFLAGRVALILRQGFVPLYIIAGLLIKAFVLPDIAHSKELIEFFATLGVMLLLSFMGLEISPNHLIRNRKMLLRAGGLDVVLNLPIGFGIGLLLGWNVLEALFLAGIVYISSSAIISKSLIDLKRVANPETDIIMGIMVFEDLFIAVYLAVLSGLAYSGKLDTVTILLSMGKALGFCAVFVVGAKLLTKQLNWLFDIQSNELFLIATFGFILLMSVAAMKVGLSEAIGAFIAGMMIANTTHKHRAEEAIAPFQLMFSAIFFVSFGMMINYKAFGQVIWLATLLIIVTGVTKVVSGYLAGRLEHFSPQTSMTIGLSIISRGEFSIVLAGVAVVKTKGALGIQPLTALYVFALAIIGSILMTESHRLSPFLVTKLGLSRKT
jgi:monovalent cation:H+ antiporter-2, CPA2 family